VDPESGPFRQPDIRSGVEILWSIMQRKAWFSVTGGSWLGGKNMGNRFGGALILVWVVSSAAAAASAGIPQAFESSRELFWAPPAAPRAYYTIDCRIDPASGRLSGTETVRFTNSTKKPMHCLALDRPSGGRILECTAFGKPVKLPAPAGSSSADEPVLLLLPEPLRPGKAVELHLKFKSSFSTRSNQIKLNGWYPRLWWGTPAWGNHSHDDFEVKVDLSPGYEVAASGRLDRKTGYYRVSNARTFALVLGKGLEAIEGNAGRTLVRCLSTPEGSECARLLLETAVDVISFYTKRFGFYPYPSLTIIPGANRPMGGYPMATSIVVIHGMEKFSDAPELHWKWITAHEIGHQYFGEYVLEGDDPGWLWIGLGIYADREYALAKGWGMKKHRGFITRYMEGVKEGHDTTVAIPPAALEKISFDFNNVVIHGKGYAIVSALDCLLGEKTFDRIYRRCMKEYGGRRLGARVFQGICEAECGQNLDWFFDQWVRSNRYLSYKIASQECKMENGRYATQVTVECLGTLKMPVPVLARFADGTEQVKFTERLLRRTELRFESAAPLEEARLDPDQELAIMTELPPSAANKALIAKIDELPWVGAGKSALDLFNEAKGMDFQGGDSWYRLGMKLYDGKYYPEALHSFEKAVEWSGEGSRYTFVYQVWKGHVIDLLGGRRGDALECYKEALERYSGLQMRHDQYGMVINKQWIEKRIREPFERK
jgi:hypothetical protein